MIISHSLILMIMYSINPRPVLSNCVASIYSVGRPLCLISLASKAMTKHALKRDQKVLERRHEKSALGSDRAMVRYR